MKFRKGAKEEPDKTIFSKPLQAKTSFSGFSPNLFIGSYGYPFLNVGALSSEEKTAIDDPKSFRDAKVDEVIGHRQQFVNSRLQMHTKNLKSRFVEQLQDIAKSSKTLDSEINLAKPIPSTLRFDQLSMPHGPSAMLKRLQLTSNAKVKRRIERLTSDTDVLAETAIQELGDVDEHHLTKLLSAGTLGRERKLVPTKWSITAVDDMRSKHLLENIRSNEYVEAHSLHSSLMGNEFLILVLPGEWSFELLEVTLPGTIYNNGDTYLLSHDYEYPQGRKRYVRETAGAYYAARLAMLEYLENIGRQGRVIILRGITPDYTAPLGVWIIREGVRKASGRKEVASAKETVNIFLKHLDRRIDAEVIIRELRLLREQQTGLRAFSSQTSA